MKEVRVSCVTVHSSEGCIAPSWEVKEINPLCGMVIWSTRQGVLCIKNVYHLMGFSKENLFVIFG